MLGSVRGGAVPFLACVLFSSTGCRATLRSAVAGFLARTQGRVAVAVKGPANGDAADTGSWDIRGDEPFAAGEAIGVFVLAELFRRVEAGEMTLDDRVSVREGTHPGRLAVLASVGELSLRDLAAMMLETGDPGATNVLIDHLGMEAINRGARSMGAGRTIIRRRLGMVAPPENYTTANDLAAAWVSLMEEGTFSAGLRRELETSLRVSRKGGLLVSAGLPSSDVRVHFDGDSPGRGVIVHGSGVLYLPDRRVAVAIAGEGYQTRLAGAQVVAEVSRIARTCYEGEYRHEER
jgi:beta-lactamase class A